MVSSEECVTTSLLDISHVTVAALGIKPLESAGDGVDQIRRHQRRFSALRVGDIGREAMQIYAEGKQSMPIGRAELCRQPGEHAREDVACASGSHAGVTGRIDERDSARSCDYGSAALQNHDGVPGGGGLERDFDTTGLHIFD